MRSLRLSIGSAPRVLALAAVVMAASLFTAAAGEARRAPRLLTGVSTNTFEVRPAVVSYTGDATGFLGGRHASPSTGDFGALHWLKWRRAEAYARGVAWLNDCDPDCADGTFHAHRARVRVTRVRHGRYTRMKIRYRWGHRWRTDRRVLHRAGAYWYWNIAY